MKLTKRTILQRLASIFDPLGFLVPFSVRGKIILQDLWLAGLAWDDAVDVSIESAATKWFQELPSLSRLAIPRCLVGDQATDRQPVELHVFADASEKAYGTVVYCRSTSLTGEVSVRQVIAKSKVAPLDTVSIPRLELQAAVLAVRLGSTAAAALDIPLSSMTLWSDSMNVLWWIRGHSRSFKTFVANRVSEIRQRTNPDQWRHVPTQQNPADLASRGCSADELVQSHLWSQGPEFLHQEPSAWPENRVLAGKDVGAEVKKTAKVAVSPRDPLLVESKNSAAQITFASTGTAVDQLASSSTWSWSLDPAKWLDWNRLTRVRAWVKRFLDNCQLQPEQRVTGELTVSEIRQVETDLIRIAQREAFSTEVSKVQRKLPLQTGSKLIPLCPFMDEDGLLRCEGRLHYATHLPHDTTHPIILPRKHAVTRMIVKLHHEMGRHVGGTSHTLSLLATRYWIIAAREAVREWEQECASCRRRKARPAQQRMAPLPAMRVNPSFRAFSRIGVDYGGPFLTIQGRGRHRAKRYLCLFTCLETRAVHLEMAYSLDTDGFLNCFYRMVSRRGLPERVVSDNGTNFVGAARELKQLISSVSKEQIEASTAHQGVQWSFNPPAAPHFGGVFECMIKAAKRAIYAVLSGSDVTDEELSTAFTGAEALLNSRPITTMSSNPNDDVPLTPNHFLFGQAGGRFAPGVDEDINLRKRWRRLQELIRHFWKRWLREWLPGLSVRSKWAKSKQNLKIGDVVLVLSPDNARGKWPLGRIVEVFPGKDSLVRVARVKIGEQSYLRPISKLCPLECIEE